MISRFIAWFTKTRTPWFIIFFIILGFGIVFGINTVEPKHSGIYCDVDIQCKLWNKDAICPTVYTDTSVLSSIPGVFNYIDKAMTYGKHGECVYFYIPDDDDEIILGNQVGTLVIPEEEEEEEVICEPEIITEYIQNVTTVEVPVEVIVEKVDIEFMVIFLSFIGVGLGLFFYLFINNILKRKYNKKIAKVQEKLNKADMIMKRDSFSPGLNQRLYEKDYIKHKIIPKKNLNIKTLPVEEMAKKIKESEGK